MTSSSSCSLLRTAWARASSSASSSCRFSCFTRRLPFSSFCREPGSQVMSLGAALTQSSPISASSILTVTRPAFCSHFCSAPPRSLSQPPGQAQTRPPTTRPQRVSPCSDQPCLCPAQVLPWFFSASTSAWRSRPLPGRLPINTRIRPSVVRPSPRPCHLSPRRGHT